MRKPSGTALGPMKAWALGLLALVSLALLDDMTRHCGVTFADGMVVAAMGWYAGVPGALGATALSVALALTSPLWHAPREPSLLDPIRSFVWLGFGLGAAVLRNRVDAVERQRLELDRAYSLLHRDLEASRLVQKAFLDRPLPRHPNMRLAVRFTPARGPSGDFYDVSLQGDRLTVCVADVSGKGAPAALVTGLLRGLLLELGSHRREPADVLAGLHARLEPYLPFNMFVTCFYAVLDLRTGELRFANAGHDPPLLWSPSRGVLGELEGTGFPLGVVEGQEFEQRERQLHPGDVLLLYTDGLVNGKLEDGSRLGEEPVRAVVARSWAPPDEIVRSLEALLPPPGPAGPEDDVLMLALQWQGQPLGVAPTRGARVPSRRARPARRRH